MPDVLATGVDYTPTQVEDWNSFYNRRGAEDHKGWSNVSPNHWLTDFDNFFTGNKAKYKAEYEKYLTDIANQNEYKATQSARAWEEYMASTQYQRAVKDLEKAGLNPWLAVQSGVSGEGSSSSAKSEYKYKHDEKSSTTKGRDIALMLLASARLIAALV